MSAVLQRITMVSQKSAVEVMRGRGNAAAAPSTTDAVIVLDAAFRPTALDHGAEAILASLSDDPNSTRPQLPDSILSQLRSRSQSLQDGEATSLYFTVGGRHYSARVFVVSPPIEGERMIALFLKRDPSVADAVRHIAADYHLTCREQEALIGLFTGLTRKELAAKMKISPNTVKAFVRLAMTKAGVSSRAHLFARLLETQNR